MNRDAGLQGEQKASMYLEDLGYSIIKRNYRVRAGEIDIIAANDFEIVFVEVKYRKTKLFGGAISALPVSRIERLRNAVSVYLSDNDIENRQIKLLLLAIQGDLISEIILD